MYKDVIRIAKMKILGGGYTMIERSRAVMKECQARLAQWRAEAGLGLLGVGLGAICMAGALVLGVEVPPEGNLFETATFNGAVGLFMWTLAVLASGVTWSQRGRSAWLRILIPTTLYAYGIETLQAFRGIDPRFSQVAGPVGQIASGVFFLTALAIMFCFIVVAVKYFRAPATAVNVAVRYGSVACLLAFGVGIWMSVVIQGRHVPESGNLLFLHATGFHGLQAVPLLAVILGWANMPERIARRRVHLAGLFWLGACIAIAWQSGSGQAVVELAPASVAAALLLLGWLVIAGVAIRAWLETPMPGTAAGISVR